MDTPGVPERGTSYVLYGVGNRSINHRVIITLFFAPPIDRFQVCFPRSPVYFR